jgi:Zn finger protein HypA/HybF involved in hydrogenase expression
MAIGRRGEEMKEKYEAGAPMVSGETVTPGKFECLECGHRHEVKEGVVNLPICPDCHNDSWKLA